jgi:hypothetical protein
VGLHHVDAGPVDIEELFMKDSDLAFLLANIFLASYIGRRWAMLAWGVYMAIFGIFFYLGR